MATNGSEWVLRLPNYPSRFFVSRGEDHEPVRMPAGCQNNAMNRGPYPQGAEAEERLAISKYAKACWHVSLIVLVTGMILSLVWTVYLGIAYYTYSPEQRFAKMRHDFAARELRRRVGGRLRMNGIEEAVNGHLLAVKELDEARHPIWSAYEPRSHFVAESRMNETELYRILRSMPKGGLLHVHDVGMFNTDRLLDLTMFSDLWACVDRAGDVEDLRFSYNCPTIRPAGDYKCDWMPMSGHRNRNSGRAMIKRLRDSLTLKGHDFTNSSDVARHMRRAQRLIYGLVSYRPLWPTYLTSMLEEFYADGVTFVELRSSLPILYDLAGTNYTLWDTVYLMTTSANIFRSIHDDFVALKLIYAPVRAVNDTNIDAYIANARFLKTHFPGIFAGLDLVSFGDECALPGLGENLQLVYISREMQFYFHAGETRCPSSSSSSSTSDDNIIDALLLGSKRLGNPLRLSLHAEVLSSMRTRRVAAEICPLSNHYMQYVNDFSQHPAAYLLTGGYPVVIGSDYPSLWDAAPLTDDFYVTFAGIANGQANLRLLKQLAINSIQYSTLDVVEKRRAHAIWKFHWDRWIASFIRHD